MTVAALSILILQAAMFGLWAFFAFRSLFRLLTLIRQTSGESLLGIRSGLAAPRLFLTDPRFERDRE